MKGRLAGPVGTNASKMVPEILGGTFSKETCCSCCLHGNGATDAQLRALAANVRPNKMPATGKEMTDWVTFASWKWTGNEHNFIFSVYLIFLHLHLALVESH